MSFQRGEKRTDFQVRCPYNPSHQMPESKLLFHISSGCQSKRDVGHMFEHCPYNFLHVVIREEMDRHLVICKSKPEQSNAERLQFQEDIHRTVQEQFANKKKQQAPIENSDIPGLAPQQSKKKRVRVRKQKNPSEPTDTGDQGLPDWADEFTEPREERILDDLVEEKEEIEVPVHEEPPQEEEEWSEAVDLRKNKRRVRNTESQDVSINQSGRQAQRRNR